MIAYVLTLNWICFYLSDEDLTKSTMRSFLRLVKFSRFSGLGWLYHQYGTLKTKLLP